MVGLFATSADLLAAFKKAGYSKVRGKQQLSRPDAALVHYGKIGTAWHWWYY